MFSQGDQILDQLRQFDERKYQLRSQASDSQLSSHAGVNINLNNSNSNTPMSRRVSSTQMSLSASWRSNNAVNNGNGIGSSPKNPLVARRMSSSFYGGSPVQYQNNNSNSLDIHENVPFNDSLAEPFKSSPIPIQFQQQHDFEPLHSQSADLQNIPELEQYQEQYQELQQQQSYYTSLKIKEDKPRYVPPINFSTVESYLYRSGHPQPNNYQFLESLKLKTIIYIGDKTDNYDYYKWISCQYGLSFKFFKLKTIKIEENKESWNHVLNLLLNKDNYPILIHSNKGKHRVGVLVGLIRKFLQGWTLSGAFDEYSKFSREKGELDLEFIEIFKPVLKVDLEKAPDFVRL